MEVWADAHSRHLYISYLLSSFHLLSDLYQYLIEISMSGNHPESVGDDQNPSKTRVISNSGYHPVGRKKRGLLPQCCFVILCSDTPFQSEIISLSP